LLTQLHDTCFREVIVDFLISRILVFFVGFFNLRDTLLPAFSKVSDSSSSIKGVDKSHFPLIFAVESCSTSAGCSLNASVNKAVIF
jgi:hypothetical protein